jgi:hypothetical protein
MLFLASPRKIKPVLHYKSTGNKKSFENHFEALLI